MEFQARREEEEEEEEEEDVLKPVSSPELGRALGVVGVQATMKEKVEVKTEQTVQSQ